MKTPLPKFPHHRGVPEHHFGDKTPLLATLKWTFVMIFRRYQYNRNKNRQKFFGKAKNVTKLPNLQKNIYTLITLTIYCKTRTTRGNVGFANFKKSSRRKIFKKLLLEKSRKWEISMSTDVLCIEFPYNCQLFLVSWNYNCVQINFD